MDIVMSAEDKSAAAYALAELDAQRRPPSAPSAAAIRGSQSKGSSEQPPREQSLPQRMCDEHMEQTMDIVMSAEDKSAAAYTHWRSSTPGSNLR